MKKGIATQTIFLIVIGLAVVGLVVALVVTNVGSTREQNDCRQAKTTFCEDWQINTQGNVNTGYDPDGDGNAHTPADWSDGYRGNECGDPSDGDDKDEEPSKLSCEGRGFNVE